MRWCVLTLLAVLGLASSAEAIVGGRAATRPYPFMAQVFVDGEFSCGGSLVRPGWVLTAQHCTHDLDTGAPYDPARIQVRLGRTRLSGTDGEEIAVAEIVRHPAYDNGSYDVALLRLARASAQAPGRIISTGERASWNPGVEALVIGWGATSSGGNVSDELLEVEVPIQSDSSCASSANAAFGYDATTMLCAGDLGGGRDSCQGDSGGPLMVTDGAGALTVMGVVSSGVGCALPLAYGIYARIGEDPINLWLVDQLPAPPPGSAAPPVTNNPPQAPPVTAPARHPRITIARDLGSAKLAARRRRLTVRLRSNTAVRDVRVSVRRGARVVASGRLTSLSGRASLAARVRRAVRRGVYTVSVTAMDQQGRRLRFAASGRLR